MTSLEWSTLWRISEGTQLWAPTKNGPVIHFSNSYFNRIAGNHSATAALLDRGMVSTAPRGRPEPIAHPAFPGAHSLAITTRGRWALLTSVAALHRPPPSAEDGTVPDWLERELAVPALSR